MENEEKEKEELIERISLINRILKNEFVTQEYKQELILIRTSLMQILQSAFFLQDAQQ